MKTKYRGICGAVRRAINSELIKGEITPGMVRSLLPEIKKDAPDNVIFNSLRRMSDLNEIEEIGSKYFTKNHAPTEPSVVFQRMCVIGGLVSTTVQDGKCLVTIEVETMNPYNN